MTWTHFLIILDVLRSVVYAWALFEAIFLMYLYGMAARQMKKTAIIRAMHLLFAALAMFFAFLTTLPFYGLFAPLIYDIGIRAIIFPAVVVVIGLRTFRIWSLEQPTGEQFNKLVRRIKSMRDIVTRK